MTSVAASRRWRCIGAALPDLKDPSPGLGLIPDQAFLPNIHKSASCRRNVSGPSRPALSSAGQRPRRLVPIRAGIPAAGQHLHGSYSSVTFSYGERRCSHQPPDYKTAPLIGSRAVFPHFPLHNIKEYILLHDGRNVWQMLLW